MLEQKNTKQDEQNLAYLTSSSQEKCNSDAIQVELPNTGFIRLPVVLAVYPVSKSTWWAGVKSGRFPKPVKLGPRITAWRVEDIKALILLNSATV